MTAGMVGAPMKVGGCTENGSSIYILKNVLKSFLKIGVAVPLLFDVMS